MLCNHFRKAYHRFRQFGGLCLLWQYTKLGCLPTLLRNGIKLTMGKVNADIAYRELTKSISPFLIERYSSFIYHQKEKYDLLELVHIHNNVIWFCWLQGIEKAPLLVQACYHSLKRNLLNYSVNVISYSNLKDYVHIPDYIIKKYEHRQIPPALFSDILRLELLIKYGGTWIDATVLCTGDSYPEKVMNGDLFLFQKIRNGDKKFYGVSNWFITSCSNNKILLLLRDVLYQYWSDYSCTLQYYMFHLFFFQIALLYPEDIAAMPRGNRSIALLLNGKLMDKYDEAYMKKLESMTCFHKLNYRVADEIKSVDGTFYYEILKRFLN